MIFSTLEDRTVWPVPGEEMSELEHKLRHSGNIRTSDLLAAASIISAYRQLLTTTGDRRAEVVRMIKRAGSSHGVTGRNQVTKSINGSVATDPSDSAEVPEGK